MLATLPTISPSTHSKIRGDAPWLQQVINPLTACLGDTGASNVECMSSIHESVERQGFGDDITH